MCSAPWYSKTRRSSRIRETAQRYSRKIEIADELLDEDEDQRARELVLDEARQRDGQHEEQPDGEREREA